MWALAGFFGAWAAMSQPLRVENTRVGEEQLHKEAVDKMKSQPLRVENTRVGTGMCTSSLNLRASLNLYA